MIELSTTNTEQNNLEAIVTTEMTIGSERLSVADKMDIRLRAGRVILAGRH